MDRRARPAHGRRRRTRRRDRDLACGEDLDGAIIRDPPGVEDRKPITTPLVTGIKALDVLTPLGRGQCMLLTGEPGTGLTRLGVGAIAAQAGSGVRCVYGATGAAAEDGGKGAVEELRAAGAMGHTTVVSVDGDASLAERYAATCAAFAVAEGARAKGETSSSSSTTSRDSSSLPRTWRGCRRS